MPTAYQVTKGLVLRVTDTKETDKILTVLTPDMGKISVIAKGARRKGSRVAAATQLLVYSDMTLYESRNWYMLNEAATISLFNGVRQDVELLSLGSYFAELTEAVTEEQMPSGEILSLVCNALYALGELKKDPETVKTAFEWRLLSLAGFEPMLDGCDHCGEEPKDPVLDVVNGVLRCRGCTASQHALHMPLCGASLAALRYIVGCEPKKLYNFSLGKEALERLSYAGEAFLSAQLERGFRTLDFYKQLAGK